ncbi:hypothetical protein SPI_07671 [Niveomyces insectorum RCEF 264]|uniref:Ubiquitin-like protein smt3 n=1 Tax=Niveomyces insectorum RCEF 264 TaxID=1081102 RepID=A0A167PHP3_9HYPO|nr:hypothetical protein SPI_07671 [Niveomyces insectorum RCEF 264]
MASEKQSADVTASVSKLTIDSAKSNAAAASASRTQPSKKKKKQEVADSWEDEEISSDDSTPPSPAPSKSQAGGTKAPPPTPITPSYHNTAPPAPLAGNLPTSPYNASWSAADAGGGTAAGAGAGAGTAARRPEKTDAVARRLIAGALGVRIPKQTEEQKAYERSLREAERKRREAEKEAQKRQEEEADKARRAIWED